MRLMVLLWMVCGVASAGDFQLFQENGKVGMKNQQGQVVLPPSFEALGWSDGSFSVVHEITGYKLNGRWGLVNLKKEFITKAEFESLVFTGVDRAIARKAISAISVKTGCISLAGKITIPFIYDALSIHGLRAVVMEKRGTQYIFGLTDLENKTILPLQFRNLYPVGSLRYAAENAEGKLALFSDSGKPLTDFFIDSIGNFYRDHAIVFGNGLQGLINRDGDVVVKPEYSKIELGETARGQQPSLWKIISSENKELQSLVADELHGHANNLYRIVRGDKHGLIDNELKPVWPLMFDAIQSPPIEEKSAVKKNGQWGLLAIDAKEILPFEYDSLIWDGQVVLASSNRTGKTLWYLINIAKDARSIRGYDQLTRINNPYFQIAKQGFSGLLNDRGEEMLHCVYDSVLEIRNNQVAVKFKGQYGIVSTTENWLLAPQSNRIRLVSDTRYLEQQPSNIFLKSFSGDIVYFTPNPVEVYPEFLVELHPEIVKKVDWDGVEIKPMSIRAISTYDEILGANPFVDGLQLFRGQDKFGFRDSRGWLIIPNRYDSAKNFSEQRAAFKLLGKWGYLDTNDKIIVNPTYDFAGAFVNGYAIVKKQNKFGLIDKSGTVQIALQYDSIIRKQDRLFVYQNGKAGLASQDGRLLVQPRYDLLEILPNSQLRVKLNDSYGILSSDGLNIIPIQYDSLEYDPAKNVYLCHQPAKWISLMGY